MPLNPAQDIPEDDLSEAYQKARELLAYCGVAASNSKDREGHPGSTIYEALGLAFFLLTEAGNAADEYFKSNTDRKEEK